MNQLDALNQGTTVVADTHLSFDADASYSRAERIIELYQAEGIAV